MPELKHNFTKGRMNKDLDERMVPNGEYRDALNIEVSVSEGSNVGTVQTLKGNNAITDLFETGATCVGTIADEGNNKLYWLVSNPSKNTAASSTQSFVTQSNLPGMDGSTKNIVHDIYSDYIMEYDEVNDETNYVVVEHYKVETTISNNNHGVTHIHISDLGAPGDIRQVGIQPGMEVRVETTYIPNSKPLTIRATVLKIESDDSGTWNGWRVYLDLPDNYDPVAIMGIKAGQKVIFELPYKKRALGFSYFSSKNPEKLITGINILDGLLFWTDGLTEPKKINIERCKYGSRQPVSIISPYGQGYPNGTNIYPTLLIVNGFSPSSSNAKLASLTAHASALNYPFLTYQHTTVIRKSPTSPLVLTMANTTRPDLPPLDGATVVSSHVGLPTNSSGIASDFFFDSSGTKHPVGFQITTTLIFPTILDWKVGDVIEFAPQDDAAGFDQEPLAVLKVYWVSANKTSFKFEVMSLSSVLQKPFINFKAKLRGKDPLFEFKFPRFAYRWKYEDGEYSCYSPFSEVAFLPEEFDYLPKKGYNLGMTNNLRYLLLSGFKPKTTPLDIVEIDILYKESNSPNVYTVETIKSPSFRVESLGTVDYEGDIGWFGRIKHSTTSTGINPEMPNTLESQQQLISQTTTTGAVSATGALYQYSLNAGFGDADIRVGDIVDWTAPLDGNPGDAVVNAMTFAIDSNGAEITWISLEDTLGNLLTQQSLQSGGDINFYRTIAKKPAIYLDDPQGSLEIESDMIHATLPANQLLRPWDNVPKIALAQEVTGNRVVYGNYVQNYDLKDNDTRKIVKPEFETSIYARKNIRDNVQYDNRTANVSLSNGTPIPWYHSLNNIALSAKMPERSIKSIRDYQMGIVYCDEYGRQTPVQTHPSGILKVPKTEANKYNGISIKVVDGEKRPDWATHFKYFVKENSNEYYNLAMDRFYDAEDGNIWLSFPSSERNKVDENTFLILKKQHDTDVFVSQKARYKIIAIENEAPSFVKTKYDSFGIASTTFVNSGEPKYQQQHLDIDDGLFSDSGGTFSGALDKQNRAVRVWSTSSVSRWYDVVSIVKYGGAYRVTVKEKFGVDMAFTTDDGTNTGTIISALSVELAERKEKNLPEFEGRFFAKIYRDGVIERNILAFAADKEYITTTVMNLGHSLNILDDRNTWRDPPLGTYGGWWCSEESPHSEDYDQFPGQLQGLQGNYIDVMQTWGAPGHKNDWDWGITRHGNNFSASSAHLDQAQKMINVGQLFRWKGDTTIYRVTGGIERPQQNWDPPPGLKKDPSNHSVAIRMSFEPRVGDMSGINNTGLDAVNKQPSGYHPKLRNAEGTTGEAYGTWANSSFWSNSDFINNIGAADYTRNIEFLEEFVADSSYSSDNPAIWETEPKEDIDVDIYNEVSEMFPINKEWNAYLNRFEKEDYYGEKEQLLNYYNCFSFNNGIESNRIRDDYNAVTIDRGPKASTVLAEQYKEERRKAGMIYSGIYNSTSGINRLNQFIQAEKITKDLNPTYGSIQKLWSKDTNLVALCEDRIIGVLANKDALFNADGNSNVTATSKVLGNATPFQGDFGISTDPESFAVDQYRAYFTDKSRGAVIRLSQQGIAPISDLGMRDYFKDVFRANNITLIGGYDDNKKLYNLTIKGSSQGSLNNSSGFSSSNSNNTGSGAGVGTGCDIANATTWQGITPYPGGAVVLYQGNYYYAMTSGSFPTIPGSVGSKWVLCTTGAGTSTGTTTSTVINTGPTPTPGNDLGNWFRYGGVVNDWAKAIETGPWPFGQANPNSVQPGTVGSTTSHFRGWTGIQAGNPTAPTGVEHGKPGGYGANPNLTNSITLWFDKITNAYAWLPATDSTINWDALILALNTNGAGNVYLYQTFLYANSVYTGSTPNALQNWPNNWSNTHQPETVYAIQSVDYDSISGTYRVVVDWLVGYSGYQDSNMFIWSLDSPFTNPSTATSSSSGTAPSGASCNEFGTTSNTGLNTTPGSVQADDWIGFNSSNTIEYDSQNITYIDVSVTDFFNTGVTAWLQDLLVNVNAGTSYNLSIQGDGQGGANAYAAGTEAVYTVASVDAIATSSSGGSYYRIYLTWDFGVFSLHTHAVKICYYGIPVSASSGSGSGIGGGNTASIGNYDDVLVNITASFSEDSKGWTSFKSWLQECSVSLNDKYFSFNGAELYQHHSNVIRNNFYGGQYDSSVCVMFNDLPSSVKSFGSLSYEGSQSKIVTDTTDGEYYNNTSADGWYADFIKTDLETGFIPEFKNKEGKWFNHIRGNEFNNLTNLNVKQFSTQGIGRPSSITTDNVVVAGGSDPQLGSLDLQIQDTSDDDSGSGDSGTAGATSSLFSNCALGQPNWPTPVNNFNNIFWNSNTNTLTINYNVDYLDPSNLYYGTPVWQAGDILQYYVRYDDGSSYIVPLSTNVPNPSGSGQLVITGLPSTNNWHVKISNLGVIPGEPTTYTHSLACQWQSYQWM